jgi:hypothetical protein
MDVDGPLVTGLISAMSGRKTGLAVTRVDEVLAHIRKTIAVTSSVARCDSCLKRAMPSRTLVRSEVVARRRSRIVGGFGVVQDLSSDHVIPPDHAP